MWNGRLKALTFSFDDGVTQDERAIAILNKYGLKATFNINSSYMGLSGSLERNGRTVSHNKINPGDVKRIYAGHELAVHTLTHPNLTGLDEATITWQVAQDKAAIEALCGKKVCGMAYPCGGTNNDDRVAGIIEKNTDIRYARTIESTYDFTLQTENLLRFNPTVYYIEEAKLFELGEKFVNLTPDKPSLLYVWGHTYEMDAEYISWERFEEFCKLVSGRDDIFYGTNAEVLLQR